ncbi:MAG: orotidine-5'-phosphate decarboxylase [Victivallales bacterium]|jgi:orotidine-5'-phosphate decarboxylase|nr:orotidine-5'-phosphate decarboxylase [Victivallales bacterium]MBT7164322.1 orotidine-5'-phosphate decarboxylase [Victivallales bacterium]
MSTSTQLIVALDVNTSAEGLALVDRIGDACTWYKVGKQLFTRYGPDMVRQLKDRGKKVFLDLKFHDIPNTVREAVRSAAAVGADMTNVHAAGGAAMLAAAAEGAQESDVLLIAVTVLTSMDEAELAGVGITASPREQVVRLAQLTQGNGVPGVVCSALEIEPLRQVCGSDFVLVVPGIRPAGSSTDDQKRVMTPGQAAEQGADFIVVGRPIRCADDPAAAARAIVAELAG